MMLLIPSSIYASSLYFTKTFGGNENDYAYCVQPTADGGYIVCGQTDSFGNGTNLKPDMWIIKLDKTGNKEWDKTFGGRESDVAYTVRQTRDMGFIVAGFTSSFGKGYPAIWIIKLNTAGDSIWSKILEGTIVSSARSIEQTSDGGYIFAGLGKENIIKLDENGNKVWGKHYSRIFYCVRQTADGGFIAAGDSIFSQQEWDYIPSHSLIKLDRNGNREWSNPLGNAFLGSAFSVYQTSDGGYVVSGDSIATKSAYNHSHYALALKLDKEGKISWKYFGNEFSSAQNILQNTEGEYVAAGNCLDDEQGLNFLIFKLNGNGTEKWMRSYGKAEQWEYASYVRQTTDGGYIVSGQTESYGAGRYDVWLLKLDDYGNTLPSGIFEPGSNIAKDISWMNIFPNHFSQSTTIVFDLPESGFVTLKIYDLYGRSTETVFSKHLPRGESSIRWNRKNLSDGMYFFRLQAVDYSESKRFVLQ